MGALKGSWTILKIGHIPIRLHWSMLLILPYLAFVIGYQFKGAAHLAGVAPQRLTVGPYVWGLAIAVALFVCVLLHELSHIAVGLHAGAEVHDVTLMMLGGVTNMTRLPRSAGWEGLMAFAGPLASGLLAALCGLAYRMEPRAAVDLRFGTFYLAEINLVLAIFNLLPAFPMDGGRILRAVLQHFFGRVRATRGAALVGRTLAVLLGLLGLYVGNVLLMLIAVFIFVAAGGESQQVELDDLVRRFTVGQVMERHPPMVDPMATISELADRIRATGEGVYFVVSPEGNLLGGVLASQVLGMPAPEAQAAKVTVLMQSQLPLATPQEPLETALRDLAGAHFPRMPVVDGDRLVGALGPEVFGNLRRGQALERQGAAIWRRRREA